jgi:hypothetical protein
MNSKQPPPIPEGIFYSIPADNFYTIANPMTGQGIGFYAQWKPRWQEFPYTRKDFVLHSSDIRPPPYKPQSGDSITLVRGLGHQTPQEEAMREDAPSSNSEWEPLVIAHMKDLPPQLRAPGASLSTPLFMLRGPATSMPRRLIAKPRDCGECDVSFECHNGKSPCIREAGTPQFVVPHDLISHEEAWRRAILLARDSTLPGSDYAYWSIELSVFNVMHKQLEDAVVIETAKCSVCTSDVDDPGLHYPGCMVRDGHCKKSGWQCDGNGNLHREVKGRSHDRTDS